MLAALTTGSCLYDSADACGPHQRLDESRCVCDEGYGLEGQSCVACGEDEVGNPTGPCACDDGLTRPAPGEPCTFALGRDCSSDSDCDADFPHCQGAPDAGYCTTVNCEPGASDCPSGFGCNDREEVAFCERPPEGLGRSCETSEQCADFEADFCEAAVTQVCAVDGCAEDSSICHGDWVCCDIELLGNSLCLAPEDLEDGACPAGGTLVPR